jgi:hypothetical protein
MICFGRKSINSSEVTACPENAVTWKAARENPDRTPERSFLFYITIRNGKQEISDDENVEIFFI